MQDNSEYFTFKPVEVWIVNQSCQIPYPKILYWRINTFISVIYSKNTTEI